MREGCARPRDLSTRR